jgi:hypothetical protein
VELLSLRPVGNGYAVVVLYFFTDRRAPDHTMTGFAHVEMTFEQRRQDWVLTDSKVLMQS